MQRRTRNRSADSVESAFSGIAALVKACLSGHEQLSGLPDATHRIEREVCRTQDFLSRVVTAVEDLEAHVSRLAGVRERVDDMMTRMQNLDERITVLARSQKCLEDASEQQRVLSQQFVDLHVINPVIQGLLPLVDITAGSSVSQSKSPAKSSRPSGREVLRSLHAHIRDILARFGVDLIECTEGSRFDPSLMRPVGFQPMSNQSKDRTVARVVQHGFRRNSTILRQVSVILYRVS